MQKLRKLFPLVGALLALAFVSCGSDSDDDSKTAGSISYATTSVEKTTADEAFTNSLTKTGDGTVSYASSKTDVAEVNTQTGLVTIKGAGETTITATVADSESYTYAVKTASYTLTVTAADTTPQKTAGSISYATATVSKITDDEPFTNELTKTGDGTVSYASSKTDVAEVNATTGLVTIKGTGEATITATVADSDTYTYATKTASYTLTVTAADTTPQKTAGSISYATTSVEKTTADEPFTNELTKTGDGTVTYASSKETVATVNEDGEVTIKGAGTATITATVADSDTYTYATKAASYTLTITQAVTYIGTKAPSETKTVGDIVFTDGSATPYSAELTLTEEQNAAAVGVCVNSDYMINLEDEEMTWVAADAKYPKDGWDLPTMEQLNTIFSAKDNLNASLVKISVDAKLGDDFYWSSEVSGGYARAFSSSYGTDDYCNIEDNTFYVRLVRALN